MAERTCNAEVHENCLVLALGRDHAAQNWTAGASRNKKKDSYSPLFALGATQKAVFQFNESLIPDP